MDTLEDICHTPVRFSEIDSMRCAWHGSYIRYLEDGRESFGRHYPGIGYADMQQAGIYAPLYDLHLTYRAPLRLNDVAEVHTAVHRPAGPADGGRARLLPPLEGALAGPLSPPCWPTIATVLALESYRAGVGSPPNAHYKPLTRGITEY